MQRGKEEMAGLEEEYVLKEVVLIGFESIFALNRLINYLENRRNGKNQ